MKGTIIEGRCSSPGSPSTQLRQLEIFEEREEHAENTILLCVSLVADRNSPTNQLIYRLKFLSDCPIPGYMIAIHNLQKLFLNILKLHVFSIGVPNRSAMLLLSRSCARILPLAMLLSIKVYFDRNICLTMLKRRPRSQQKLNPKCGRASACAFTGYSLQKSWLASKRSPDLGWNKFFVLKNLPNQWRRQRVKPSCT